MTRSCSVAPAICLSGIVITNSAAGIAPAYKATLLGADFVSSIALDILGSHQVGHAVSPATGNLLHAIVWNGSADNWVDLHPDGPFVRSFGYGASETNQVGWGLLSTTDPQSSHALLWSGTAESVVDLHPEGFRNSYARGVWGTRQVGSGRDQGTDTYHALLWNGTAESVVDLHPTEYDYTTATDVWGDSQVGEGIRSGIGERFRALLWHGTAKSLVDLHPSGQFEISHAVAIWGTTQVGYRERSYPARLWDAHALLWNGTAESVADLHPVGFDDSYATDVSAAGQVGYGSGPTTGGENHALMWNGTATSVVDLHRYLAPLAVEFIRSAALGIEDNGAIVGSVYDGTRIHAVLWTPIPEPGSIWLICIGVVGVVAHRQRHGARCRVPNAPKCHFR
jgi:uncharacterized membrane protein